MYYDFLQFKLAKKAVAENDFDAAASALDHVVKKAANEVVENIARIRLARIYIAQNKPQQALDLLNKETDAFKYLFSDIRGDALLALGQNEKARQAYLIAQENFKGNGQDKELQMKIDDLTVSRVMEDKEKSSSRTEKSTEDKQQTPLDTETEVEKG